MDGVGDMKSHEGDESVCGTGEGSCCYGSNDDCTSEAPVCSEFGYCQCASYQPGGVECGPGFGREGAPDPWPKSMGDEIVAVGGNQEI